MGRALYNMMRAVDASAEKPTNASAERQPRSSRRRRWLCIAYAFPPISRSGTHRTLGFVRHLDRLGWDATVLTVDPRDEPIDESLNVRVPPRTTIVRAANPNLVGEIKSLMDWRSFLGTSNIVGRPTTASRSSQRDRSPRMEAGGITRCLRDCWDFFSRFLQTPDSRTGWIVPAVFAGLRAVRRQRPSVIYSTSPYASAHLIAYVVSRLTRIPWVVDFRDPWRGNPYARSLRPWLDGWDGFLERRVLMAAHAVVCCTPTMTQLLRIRYPALPGRTATILNGFDAEVFEGIRPARNAAADEVVLMHCGQFYGPRTPHVLFAALRRAMERSPELAGRVRLDLIGPDEFEGRSLKAWADDAGVGERVNVVGVKGHAETLARMLGSDALVLVGSQGAGADLQIPNKLFEYLAAKRPIIAACPRSSPVYDILGEAGAACAYHDPRDEQGLADAIVDAAASRCRGMSGGWSGVARFERSHRAAELHAVFESVRIGAGERSIPKDQPTAVRLVDRRITGIALRTRVSDRIPNQRLEVEQGVNQDGGDERAGALVGVAEDHAE